MISSFKELLCPASRIGYVPSGLRLVVNLVFVSSSVALLDPVSCGTAKVEELFIKTK